MIEAVSSMELFLEADATTSVYATITVPVLLDIMSRKQREMFDIVNYVFLCSFIGCFGLIGNIINILVFVKQGFSNTVNISFLGLAVSDICCLVTLLWVGICMNPWLSNVGLPWIPAEFQYLTGAWPHIIFGRITSYITAYVTVERCLCIAAPLKVKTIITARRTAIAVGLIYFLNIVTLVPEYATSYFEWRFLHPLNRTVLTMAFTNSRPKFVGVVFFLTFFTGILSFVIVIIFTIVLVVKLRQTSNWRKEISSGADQRESMSVRDKKTVKMIAVIASVLIVCYTPGTVITLTTFVEPEFMLLKRYENTCFAMWSIGYVFQAANSSVNILLYYTMSTKYKQTFHELFMCANQEVENVKRV